MKVPLGLGGIAAMLTGYFAHHAPREDIDSALTVLVTLNAIAVGLGYAATKHSFAMLRVAAVPSAAEQETEGNEPDRSEEVRFGEGALLMLTASLLGVFLAAVHLAWHPIWWPPYGSNAFPLGVSVACLVAAPVVIPLLAFQEVRLQRTNARRAEG